MDTNDKNREAQRKRRPQQGAKNRPASAEEQQSRRKEAPKKPASKPAAQRPKAQQAAQKHSAQQGPAQQKAAQQRPAQTQQPASQPRRQRPAQQNAAPHSAQQNAAQRPARDQQTVLQGGPHQRAASQRSPQQRAAKQQPARKQSGAKRTAKKNPLQSLIAGIGGGKKKTPAQEAQARERRQKRAAEAERKRKQAERNNTPAVIYTAPQPFNRNRLLVQLTSVMAVVVALIMGMSVFFKVENITVAGAETYSAWTVREASGIQEGDGLLTFSRGRAGAQIYAELSYVEKVRVGIKLPDTVIIYIEEADVAYAIKSSDGTWWLMTSGGRVAEQIDSASAEKYTQVLGVTLANPEEGKEAIAKEDFTSETESTEAAVSVVTVTGAQRLAAALEILNALEANDIVGEAASVDVTYLDEIELWYGSRYQVKLGDINNTEYSMEYKIACMNDAILQLSDYQTGILDITFTTFGDQVGYTPFS